MDTAPLRWQDSVLELLDQRELPARETWLRCEEPGHVADAIRSLAVRGAPAIGIAAAYGLALAVAGAQRCGEEERVLVGDAAAQLRATRPTAVNLGWALDRGLAAFERAQGVGEDPAEALLRSAHTIAEEQMAADRRLSELAAERFRKGDRALTHCNTGPLATGGYGTAGGVLRAAWDAGRLAQVWVCETRPLLQGARLTAWELGRAGIPHRLVTDSSAGTLMARGLVDQVVVGADRIAANGDVANKVGTYPLAVLAARHEIPFYVAAPTSTLDPATPDGASVEIEERDPGEVTGAGATTWAPAGTDALNLAFDVTPAELVTAIATEAGMLEPPYEEAIARVARPMTV
ncbi:MAG TPA: S-methyl-5-thioribose-1-phosphate isomerase [Thermoleophilaceae bacterium]|nr:S-methyl-5-thioribose-1-phosphate isomerase [Thermoleophilaceae bacterium]